MKTGRKAIFGIGIATETIGSKNHRAARLRAIRMPSTMPSAAAIPKPTTIRYRVCPRLIGRSPEIVSSHDPLHDHRSGGSRNVADRAAAGEALPGDKQQDQRQPALDAAAETARRLERRVPLGRRNEGGAVDGLGHSRHRRTRFISIR